MAYDLSIIRIYEIQLKYYNGNSYRAWASMSKDAQNFLMREYPERFPANRHGEKCSYKKMCWDLTESNKHLIDGIEKRNYNEYHIDHIVPIFYGEKRGIPIEKIGSIENLRIIPKDENLKKGAHLTNDSRELLAKWGYI
jgi:hypothetical protein